MIRFKGAQMIMPSRYQTKIDTGHDFELPSGYRLCFSVSPELAERGVIITNIPGRLVSGRLVLDILNAGRNVVAIKEDDPIAIIWLEQDIGFIWEGET